MGGAFLKTKIWGLWEPAAGEKFWGVEITQNVQKTCFWGSKKVRFSDFLEFLRKPPPLLRRKIFKGGGFLKLNCPDEWF